MTNISRINLTAMLNDMSEIMEEQSGIRIHNVQATVSLLDEGEKLSLERVTVMLGGMAKYDVSRFAAAILRLSDSIATTTCLVFRQGTLVVVGARSIHHNLLACHNYRLRLEAVTKTEGRTRFRNFQFSNIVANTCLPCRPNLKAFADILSEISNYCPDLFPAIFVRVWLYPRDACQCARKRKNPSCKHSVRAVMFDSGMINFVGCKTLSGAAQACSMLTQVIMQTPELQSASSSLPSREMRFETRRRQIIEAALAFLDFEGTSGRKKTCLDANVDTLESLSEMVSNLREANKK